MWQKMLQVGSGGSGKCKSGTFSTTGSGQVTINDVGFKADYITVIFNNETYPQISTYDVISNQVTTLRKTGSGALYEKHSLGSGYGIYNILDNGFIFNASSTQATSCSYVAYKE